MNERIKELAAQCEEYKPGFNGQEDWYTVFNKQKFAAALIKDCANWIRENYDSADAEVLAHHMEIHYGLHKGF